MTFRQIKYALRQCGEEREEDKKKKRMYRGSCQVQRRSLHPQTESQSLSSVTATYWTLFRTLLRSGGPATSIPSSEQAP
jgi:hypothetical protein